MNEDFDIGKYKPEELQLRNNCEVVNVYKNNIRKDDSFFLYSVVFLYEDDHCMITVSKNGLQNTWSESPYDVILKPRTINLEDYLDKPELLQLRNGSEITGIYLNENHCLVIYKNKYINHRHDYTKVLLNGLRYDTGELDDYDVILKPQPKPVEKNELQEVWELYKRYYVDNSLHKLLLFGDESGRILNCNNATLYDFDSLDEAIVILNEELNNV